MVWTNFSPLHCHKSTVVWKVNGGMESRGCQMVARDPAVLELAVDCGKKSMGGKVVLS